MILKLAKVRVFTMVPPYPNKLSSREMEAVRDYVEANGKLSLQELCETRRLNYSYIKLYIEDHVAGLIKIEEKKAAKSKRKNF